MFIKIDSFIHSNKGLRIKNINLQQAKQTNETLGKRIAILERKLADNEKSMKKYSENYSHYHHYQRCRHNEHSAFIDQTNYIGNNPISFQKQKPITNQIRLSSGSSPILTTITTNPSIMDIDVSMMDLLSSSSTKTPLPLPSLSPSPSTSSSIMNKINNPMLSSSPLNLYSNNDDDDHFEMSTIDSDIIGHHLGHFHHHPPPHHHHHHFQMSPKINGGIDDIDDDDDDDGRTNSLPTTTTTTSTTTTTNLNKDIIDDDDNELLDDNNYTCPLSSSSSSLSTTIVKNIGTKTTTTTRHHCQQQQQSSPTNSIERQLLDLQNDALQDSPLSTMTIQTEATTTSEILNNLNIIDDASYDVNLSIAAAAEAAAVSNVPFNYDLIHHHHQQQQQ